MTAPTPDRAAAPAKKLGAARAGVAHWWAQRASAVLLIPLTLWLTVSLIVLTGQDYAGLLAWFGRPLNAALTILLLLLTFWHGALGLQVVIEDYVHGEGRKLALLLAVKGLAALLAILGCLAVVKLAVQG